jgi:DNA polymerase III subunit delta'
MSFNDFPEQREVVQLLQRSLERGRLGHGYLFVGTELAELEAVARTLAKTLNCENPPRRAGPKGLPLDCCNQCPSCRKIDNDAHPDLLWVRPESKLRIIKIEQIRDLMQTVHLKPTHAPWKVAVIEAAERLNPQAANAFLKTLEEPPPDSIIILLSTEPQRLLETILSRCLRLNFAGEASHHRDPEFLKWLEQFSETASREQRSLLSRYQLLSTLLSRLNEIKTNLTETLTQKSPLEKFDDLTSEARDKFEAELAAAIEAEYRRHRADVLTGVEWWLRDVWMSTLGLGDNMLTYPQLVRSSQLVARRITPQQAMENLAQIERTQRRLYTNVQEPLTLEVGLLQLKL